MSSRSLSRRRRSKSLSGGCRAVVWPRGSFLLTTDFLSTFFTKELNEKCLRKSKEHKHEKKKGCRTKCEKTADNHIDQVKALNSYNRNETIVSNTIGNKENCRLTIDDEHGDLDVIDLSSQLVYEHLYRRRTRIITYGEWLEFARMNARFTDSFAFAVFSVAQCVASSSLVDTRLATDVVNDIFHDRVCVYLWPLALTVVVLNCDRSRGGNAVADYFRKNIDRICWLALLCGDVDFADKTIRSPIFNIDDMRNAYAVDGQKLKVPLNSFTNLNELFEATVFEACDSPSVAAIVPQPISHVLSKLLIHGDCDTIYAKVSISTVVLFIGRVLQSDVFRLNDYAPPRHRGRASSLHTFQTSKINCRAGNKDGDNDVAMTESNTIAVRSITSTQLAAHRRLTVRAWTHAELLTNATYAGGNLCVQYGSRQSSAIFHPYALKSAVVLDCTTHSLSTMPSMSLRTVNTTEIPQIKPNSSPTGTLVFGPIVLGPIADCLLIRRVHGARISVIANRIFVDDCSDLTLFVNIRVPILIAGNCERIFVAPYNVYYDGLSYELNQAGLRLVSASENMWDHVVQVESVFCSNITSLAGERCWEPLVSTLFYIQPMPFPANQRDNDFYNKTFAGSVTPIYLDAWTEQRATAERLLKRATRAEREQALLIYWTRADLSYLWRRVERK